MADLLSLDDVRAAARAISGHVERTPTVASPGMSALLGVPVTLKLELLQRSGSFKPRGVAAKLLALDPAERDAGVVAVSGGNHGIAVAEVAGGMDVRATVVMARTAPPRSIERIRAAGADLQLTEDMGAAFTLLDELVVDGMTLVHPFDDPTVLAGQGTVGLEVLEQCPDVRTVVVCTGGGGLVSGIAAAVRSRRPDVRIVAVQAETAACFPGSLAAGRPVQLEAMATMADGIAVAAPGPLTLAHVRDLVDEVRTVSEEDLSRAMLFCLERAKLVVEPAGVAAVAALLADPAAFEAPVVAVVSGGNIDPVLMMKVVQHGMAAVGRYSSLRLHVPDRPGSLAGVLAELAAAGANVLEVEHERTGARLHLGEVEIFVVLETRGPDHATEVVSALRRAGYAVSAH